MGGGSAAKTLVGRIFSPSETLPSRQVAAHRRLGPCRKIALVTPVHISALYQRSAAGPYGGVEVGGGGDECDSGGGGREGGGSKRCCVSHQSSGGGGGGEIHSVSESRRAEQQEGRSERERRMVYGVLMNAGAAK